MSDKSLALINHLLEKNKNYSPSEIIFTEYCKRKMFDRGIEENLVVQTIKENNDLYFAQKQEITFQEKTETRYKLIYKISSRYSLIIVVVYEAKVLKVINVIKTSKTAEKLWRKKVSE